MIAGKIKFEILAMNNYRRHLWYKTISFEEKEKAMRIIGAIKQSKQSKFMIDNSPAKRPEVRAKMRSSHTSKIQSEDTKIKISEALMGHTVSEETRSKQSVAWTPERRAWWSVIMTDRVVSEKTRDKFRGENNPNWNNGSSFEPYGLDFNNELKEQIRKRDNYTCQKCGKTQDELDRKLDVHHIDYDKTNNRPENLISLCGSCHMKTNYNREDWIEYFEELIKTKRSLENESERSVS